MLLYQEPDHVLERFRLKQLFEDDFRIKQQERQSEFSSALTELRTIGCVDEDGNRVFLKQFVMRL
jgi:hypothetical protein